MKRHAQLALALALSLSLAGVLGCSSASSQDTSSSESIEKEEDVVLSEKDVTEADDTDADTEDADTTTATKQVGAKGVGFVSIPESWVEFNDVDGNTSIQWCDGTPYTVVSLNTFNLDSVPEEERAGFTTEDAANSVWQNMLNDGAVEDSVQGARVTLADHDALQVYGIYPDGSYLVTWLLQDEEGVIRYVAAEGTEGTIMDTVAMVQDTYQL